MKLCLTACSTAITAMAISSTALAQTDMLPPSLLPTYQKSVEALAKGDKAAARKALQDTITGIEALENDGPPKQRALEFETFVYNDLGGIDEDEGKAEQAQKDYASAIAHTMSGHSMLPMFHALDRIAAIDYKNGYCERAIRSAETAMKFADMPQYHQVFTEWKLRPLVTLGKCHARQNANDRAKQEFDAAWALAEKMANPGKNLVEDLQKNSSALYRSMGLKELADATEARAAAIHASTPETIPVFRPPQ